MRVLRTLIGSQEWIIGDRVGLRPVNEGDTEYILRWRSEPSVLGQLFGRNPPKRSQHEAFLVKLGKSSERKEFIICHMLGVQPIGQIGLSSINREQGDAEFAILIGEPNHRGKGLAEEACRLLLGHAFKVLGLRRLRLNLFADNGPARRLYERLGFIADPKSAATRLKDGVTRPTILMDLDLEALGNIEPGRKYMGG
jgi:RimJ/RimL family protein N-acetyltransferase